MTSSLPDFACSIVSYRFCFRDFSLFKRTTIAAPVTSRTEGMSGGRVEVVLGFKHIPTRRGGDSLSLLGRLLAPGCPYPSRIKQHKPKCLRKHFAKCHQILLDGSLLRQRHTPASQPQYRSSTQSDRYSALFLFLSAPPPCCERTNSVEVFGTLRLLINLVGIPSCRQHP